MKARKLFACMSLVMIFSMLIVACQPQKIIETVVVTEVVREMVAGTPVEKIIEKIVTPTPLPPSAVPPTAEPKLVDTVVFGLQQEPDTMHPSLSTMTASTMVTTPIFPGCMVQNEKTEWVPMGCERVPSLENGDAVIVGEGEDRHLEVTYKIRKDWRWTDGTPVTAKDAIYWWKLNMDPDFESQGRLVIEKIYDITVVDDHTLVVIYLSAKQIHEAVAGALTGQVNFAAFKDDYASNFTADWPSYAVDPSYFFNIGWLPEHLLAGIPAADQDSSEWARKPVGDGAFEVQEWNPGQEIILVASNQPFPLGEPKVKTIIFRFFGDGAAVKAALQNGEIDAALGTPSGLTEKDGQDLDAIEAQGRYKVDWVPQFNNERIDINLEHFPLDDMRIRQALYYAMDRQAINDVQYFGKKALLDVPLPKGLSWAYPPEDKITIYNYDPEKAKALIAEAGWDCSGFPCTKEVDGVVKKLEFTFLTTDRQDRMAVAQMLQSMWRQVGIGVNLQFLYGRGLFQNCSAGGPLYCRTYDLAMYGSSFDDAATFFGQYSCGAIPSESNNWSGQNTPGWCNEAANAALNESENNPEIALSREKRLPYITTFFTAMTSEVPQLFLYGASWPYPHLVGWKNFKPGATQYSLPTWNSWEWEVYK